MNNKKLHEAIAANVGCTKQLAEQCLNAAIAEIAGALKSGDEVKLRGFCNFYVIEREERTGRNPRTNEQIVISARKRVGVKVSDELHNKVK